LGGLNFGDHYSGITRFSTGLPVTLIETDDNSLLGTQNSGPIQLGIDVPNYIGGPVHNNDPRSGKPYFDPSGFMPEPLGHLGNAKRRFFHGPSRPRPDVVSKLKCPLFVASEMSGLS
jgi:hypothetical protein